MTRKSFLLSMLLTVVCGAIIEREKPVRMTSRPSLEEYMVNREKLYQDHINRGLGHDIVLTEKEEQVNRLLMKFKEIELERGFKNPQNFTPSRHVFEVLQSVKESPLFELLHKMPKGAVLHSHDTALVSTDFVLSLTYTKHLWQLGELSSGPEFIFAKNSPGANWTLVSELREKMGADNYDREARKLFTLLVDDPITEYRDINTVWDKFNRIFMCLGPIVTYVPCWKSYFRQALKEFYADGVQLLEFRGVLPNTYDLEGNIYGPIETTQMYVDILTEFKAANPDFIGAKFIYAPIRRVSVEEFKKYRPITEALLAKFPDFVMGFDVVGQEDMGTPLKDFASEILQYPENINFFWHAGETNWNGRTSDENLIDAILLGTKRIGHGFGLTKYPTLMKLIKQRNICVEINPISNQVLKLVEDYRNHPAAIFMSDDYPIVISSDDPSFWEVSPLTHDFYFAFLGIASAHQDLRCLKKLILNSLHYSTLTQTEKVEAERMWNTKWNQFIDSCLREDYRNRTQK